MYIYNNRLKDSGAPEYSPFFAFRFLKNRWIYDRISVNIKRKEDSMTHSELESMTVLQLRKLAKENHITLGAGIGKAGMIEKLSSELLSGEQQERMAEVFDAASEAAPEFVPVSEDVAERIAEEVAEASDAEEAEPASDAREAGEASDAPAESTAEPKYQAAWHSPDAAQTLGRTSHQPGFSGTRPTGFGPAARPLAPEQRSPLRATPGAPRFGPGPALSRAPAAPSEADGSQAPAARPAVSPLPDHRVGFGGGAFGPRPTGTFVTSAAPSPAPASEPVQAPAAQESSVSPTLEELLASGEYEEGSGILELHPDGYGFLRAAHFLPSSRDIYVSMAQIRRFGLRTGDLIRGKVRPQREGDKYAALLYIDSINGIEDTENMSRPLFDELTPTYPTRRISLESKKKPAMPDMRLIDLIAPLGFGQRGLLLCPPDTGKRELMQNYARVILDNFPETEVLMLLIDLNPEDVTLIRESVPCPVLASTFDQAPESHLRLTEMVLERAMRLVEAQKDVVILADSLTRLAKVYTSAAVQQGRSLPGMVNPSSLLRAKKLFGSARACKEGGSLTVIAAMDIATGSRVDDSVVEEFKGTANMELVLDQAVARAGVSPAINLQRSYTRNADLLLDNRQKEGLALIRQMLGSTPSAVAIPQLLSMMEKAPTNKDLLLRMKDWFALMNR